MVMHERSEAKNTSVSLPAQEPTPPKALSETEIKEIQAQAAKMVVDVGGGVTGSVALQRMDDISAVGTQAQREAAGQFDLLKARMSTFLNEGGAGRDIAEGLRDLRLTLDQINPQAITQASLPQRVVAALPLIGGRFNPISRAMRKVAIKYEPVSRQVTMIETRLREGRALLARDNVELRQLYEGVESHHLPIQQSAYLGELLMGHLSKLLDETEDPVTRDRLENALHNVVTRVQDLRSMEEVHLQYFASIEMTRNNNDGLGQSVERTLSMATNMVTVGLAIQAALIRQRKVMEASARTREFLGALLVSNAASIKRHTREIGDLQNQPVIAMDKLTQAHDDLVEAITTASQLRLEGIQAAQGNIVKLGALTAKLEQKLSGMTQIAADTPQVLPEPGE